jgi:hypothetical protein
MSTAKIPLATVKVASPCTASWDAMAGDNRARFCGQCSQHVYNLSELTQDAAEALIFEHEGKMCVRYFRRFDGTILTKDCPVGWRGLKRRVVIAGSVTAAVFVALLGYFALGVFAARIDGNNGGGRFRNAIVVIRDLLFPRQVRPPQEVMGDICVLPPPAGGNPPPAIQNQQNNDANQRAMEP